MQASACYTERRNVKLRERQVAIIAVIADGEMGVKANADENKKCGFFTYYIMFHVLFYEKINVHRFFWVSCLVQLSQ